MSVMTLQQDETYRTSYPGHDEFTMRLVIAVPEDIREHDLPFELRREMEDVADAVLVSHQTDDVQWVKADKEYHYTITANFTREF